MFGSGVCAYELAGGRSSDARKGTKVGTVRAAINGRQGHDARLHEGSARLDVREQILCRIVAEQLRIEQHE